jgi:hypothetical protein
MKSAPELELRLQELLAAFGSTAATELAVRHATRECRNDMYADATAHGCSVGDPFVNFLVLEKVAVFTFFTDPFEFYVLACDDARSLISGFESSGLAMEDIEGHKRILSETYGKHSPDLTVARPIAEYWMEMS